MTTTRSLRDDLNNIQDYLADAGLALYTNPVAMSPTRVSFHSHRPDLAFLPDRGSPSVNTYLAWVEAGAYSSLLLDGSLLQITYDIEEGRIVGHRLAYVPCPYDVDHDLLASGEALIDVLSIYLGDHPMLRSPIRFDYDLAAARTGHPAAHLTINDSNCRIACVAPLHALRFVDFVFRNFYPSYWRAHRSFFESAQTRHLARGRLSDTEIQVPHLMWSQDSSFTSSEM